MRKKKAISMILALAMCAGMTTPAYASEITAADAIVTEAAAENAAEETDGSDEAAAEKIDSFAAKAGEFYAELLPEDASVDFDAWKEKAAAMTEQVLAQMPTTYSIDEDSMLEIQIYELILLNMIRTEYYGCDVLGLDSDLADAAVQRAKEASIYFDHTRPDGRDWYTIYSEYGIAAGSAGENLAMGQTSVDDAMLAWMNSDGHRENMLSTGYQTIGIGADNSAGFMTWCQLFAGGYTVKNVELMGLQEKYSVGADLSQQGIVAVVEYTNGRSSLVPLIASMISGYDANRLGEQKVRISLQGTSVTVKINVFDGVKEFVERLYQDILGRSADPSGLAAWTDVLRSGREQGAKVAQGFIESTEFKNRSLSDKEYLTTLYHTFFDRKPDTAGLNAWLKVLDSGLSRMHVFRGFAESEEFSNICASYGIERGNALLQAPADQNEGVTKFVVRCYRLCLGRREDSTGLNEWCNAILTGKNTAKQAAFGFVFSDEFQNKKLSDTEFVKVLYRVFMDREADASGLNAWVNVLRNGESREHVFDGFADSVEFQNICARYGI